MRMPVMNGDDAASKIKADQRTAHIPIIAVTASVIGAEANLIAQKCDAFLAKPVIENDILSALSRFLPRAVHEGASSGLQGIRQNMQDYDTTSQKPMVSAEQRESMIHVIQKMETTMYVHYTSIMQTQIVGKIKDFATELNNEAIRWNIEELASYSQLLQAAIAAYNVKDMRMLLAQYPDVIAALKQIAENSSDL